MKGQSPEHLLRMDPTPFHILAQPSALLSAHSGPCLPGPTSFLCVLREDQEQDTATISTTELRCHPNLIACPETCSGLETEVSSGGGREGAL